jgi:surfeit locus 1 family protein
VGGLTVISFPNNHLIYALTWFGLALMTGGAIFWTGRDDKRRRLSAGQKNKDGKQAPDAG